MLACGGHRNIPPAVAVFFVVDKGEALRTHCVGPPLLSGGVAWKEGITRPALVELQAYLAHHTHHCFHLLTAGQSLLLDVAECFGPQSRRTFVHKAHSTFGFSGWVLHHCRPSFSFFGKLALLCLAQYIACSAVSNHATNFQLGVSRRGGWKQGTKPL